MDSMQRQPPPPAVPPSLYELANMTISPQSPNRAVDSSSDPLAAFDLLERGGAIGAGAGMGGGSNRGGGGGAVRARHDIFNNTNSNNGTTASRPIAVKSAWTAPPQQKRPPSPMGQGQIHVQVGTASSSSKGGQIQVQVGSGSSSSKGVYRHGSPSPNSSRGGGRGGGAYRGSTSSNSSLEVDHLCTY